jgi:hypothetical protein
MKEGDQIIGKWKHKGKTGAIVFLDGSMWATVRWDGGKRNSNVQFHNIEVVEVVDEACSN